MPNDLLRQLAVAEQRHADELGRIRTELERLPTAAPETPAYSGTRVHFSSRDVTLIERGTCP